ncbi:MAG: hypothetical protein IPO91_08985 [Chloroflexi bacterium]|nr:hypothetical protein [Chloroflexota bacterium]
MYKHKDISPFVTLSGLAAILTIVAALIGLFTPDFYPIESESFLLAAKAQDIIALLAAVIMVWAIVQTWNGSTRAVAVWAGCLGYLTYSYLLYSMDQVFTSLYIVYIAILGLCLYSLIGVLGRLNGDKFRLHVDQHMPRRLIALVLAIPAILIPPWIAFATDPVLRSAPNAIVTVNVIDLSFVIPACLATAYLVWKRQTWGFIFAGVLLVKLFTMGLSLVIATFWAYFTLGTAIDPLQTPIYIAMMLAGGFAAVRYLQHIHDTVEVSKKQTAQRAKALGH